MNSAPYTCSKLSWKLAQLVSWRPLISDLGSIDPIYFWFCHPCSSHSISISPEWFRNVIKIIYKMLCFNAWLSYQQTSLLKFAINSVSMIKYVTEKLPHNCKWKEFTLLTNYCVDGRTSPPPFPNKISTSIKVSVYSCWEICSCSSYKVTVGVTTPFRVATNRATGTWLQKKVAQA